MERYRDLPKATQLAGGRAGMQSPVGLPRSGACVNPQTGTETTHCSPADPCGPRQSPNDSRGDRRVEGQCIPNPTFPGGPGVKGFWGEMGFLSSLCWGCCDPGDSPCLSEL